MKTVAKIIIISIFVVMTGCDPLSYVYLTNQSSVTIHTVFGYEFLYPDTSLPKDPRQVNLFPIKAGETISVMEDLGCISSGLFYMYIDGGYGGYSLLDTVSLYIIGADTVAYYSWDTVAKYNMYLQRYDLSFTDLVGLEISTCSPILFFPPTEDMKHIHMWPPYGTYDEHGQKKNKKE